VAWGQAVHQKEEGVCRRNIFTHHRWQRHAASKGIWTAFHIEETPGQKVRTITLCKQKGEKASPSHAFSAQRGGPTIFAFETATTSSTSKNEKRENEKFKDGKQNLFPTFGELNALLRREGRKKKNKNPSSGHNQTTQRHRPTRKKKKYGATTIAKGPSRAIRLHPAGNKQINLSGSKEGGNLRDNNNDSDSPKGER